MNINKFPDGWTQVTLQSIASWGSGGTPSRSQNEYYNGEIPWIKTGDLGPKFITQASEFITEAGVKNSSAKFFTKGSVALAMYGATIGKTSILGIDATTNQACAVGTPTAGVTYSEFLYYLLLNEKKAFINKGKGGAQPNISQAVIKEHTVCLPPIAEQKIIADKLDDLLARVESIKTRLENITEILKKFRQSVLSAAVSGKLTESNDSLKSKESYQWSERKLSEVGLLSRGKSKHRPRNDPRLYGSNYPFIQTSEIANSFGRIKESKKFYSEFGLSQSKLFPKGSLCITIAANIADTAILDIDACFPDSIVGFIPYEEKANVIFIKYLIDVNKDDLEASAPATAQKNINLKVLSELKISLPSVEEQNRIVILVENMLSQISFIERTTNDVLSRVNHLTQSILAKAFRGELTAQWREENPELISGLNSAEALLENITAEKLVSGTIKKRSKKFSH